MAAFEKIATGLGEAITMAKLESRVADLEAENVKLREALAPFADAAAFMDDDWDDSEHLVEFPMGDGKVYCVFVSTFRNARAALTKGTTTTGGDANG